MQMPLASRQRRRTYEQESLKEARSYWTFPATGTQQKSYATDITDHHRTASASRTAESSRANAAKNSNAKRNKEDLPQPKTAPEKFARVRLGKSGIFFRIFQRTRRGSIADSCEDLLMYRHCWGRRYVDHRQRRIFRVKQKNQLSAEM